jgi:uncharacterized protein YndB with AHSA1/START domain
MIDTAAATHALVVERVMPHPPEKIWRALTQGALIEEWLMPNDQGANYGWQKYVAGLERVAAGLK